jgi:hypothetical protein
MDLSGFAFLSLVHVFLDPVRNRSTRHLYHQQRSATRQPPAEYVRTMCISGLVLVYAELQL